MDFKKVLDQTVRELKREVNKKVLKVPEIEQKVLDATSNEPWGPHGTVMADIAQATRNYNDYQMIMSIIWKRINDTGRNWRHVYKALTVLEYLVAHGSERVIDELREHAYQISTLADFQYVESSGRDQGINVRKKSQSLVALVNDKEKIREVRQKAVENRDKYRGVSSTGGIYKPSSYHSTGGSYGGDRYEEDSYGSTSRYAGSDDDRYGRDRDGDRYRGEDRYGKDWDRNGRDSDRSGRGGDRYRDDYNRDYDQEEDRYSSKRGDDRQSEKYRSFEKDHDRAYDDDDRHASRSGGGRGDDFGQDDRRADRKPSGARMPAPPSYEEASGSHAYQATEDQRDGGGLAAAVARASKSNTGQFENLNSMNKAPSANSQVDDFEEFDPRASSVAVVAPFQAGDLFGEAEPAGAIRALPPPTGLSSAISNASDFFSDSSNSGVTPAAPAVNNTPLQQLDGDVFGNSPFKVEAPAYSNFTTAPAAVNPPPSFMTLSAGNGDAPAAAMGSNSFNAFAAAPPPPLSQAAAVSFVGDEFFGHDSFSAFGAASNGAPPAALPLNIPAPPQEVAAGAFHVNQAPSAPMPTTSQPLLPGARQGQNVSLNTYAKPQSEKKFETKSTVWADTLSKGLIDLNIAGPKSNPLAGIGIDFDLLRTERIKEERASTKTSTTIGMGKAMGSGSGLGIAGASAIVTPAAPVMMSNMGMAPSMGLTPMNMGIGMGMGMGPVAGSGMGMAPPMMGMGLNSGMTMRPGMGMGPAPGMGMGMNSAMGMGMGMNSAMGMGMGSYSNQQQQYSGYR